MAWPTVPERGWEWPPEATLPTPWGFFRLRAYPHPGGGPPDVALIRAGSPGQLPTVRVHSECLTGEAFGSLRCDCGPQLRAALDLLGHVEGPAALIYLRQEGRGIGLLAKVEAYALQDQGLDTYQANLALGLPADGRSYAAAAEILKGLGWTRIRLITNNPDKVRGLTEAGLEVAHVIPLLVAPTPYSRRYLRTKRDRFGHRLPQVDP
jgi:3,4-dihydroxy 2-butanone 4-phosphate synthase/GTP cyclohydrolase II